MLGSALESALGSGSGSGLGSRGRSGTMRHLPQVRGVGSSLTLTLTLTLTLLLLLLLLLTLPQFGWSHCSQVDTTSCTASWLQIRNLHGCRRLPVPPKRGMSRQAPHLPQLPARQPAHTPQRCRLPPPRASFSALSCSCSRARSSRCAWLGVGLGVRGRVRVS